jgi:PAS domain S-box-containing protein
MSRLHQKGVPPAARGNLMNWRNWNPKSIPIVFGVAFAYGVAGRVSLLVPFNSFASLIWAPSGIALYSVLRWGPAGALGTVLGTLAFNLFLHQPVPAAIAIAIGNVLPALIARRLLSGKDLDHLFGETLRVSRFIAIGVLGVNLISAAIGVTALKFSGMSVPGDWATLFGIWWAGDAMGVLAITPALFALDRLRRGGRPRLILEFLLLAAGFALVWYLLFVGILGHSAALPLSYAAIPLMLWTALRFDQAVVVLVSLALSLTAIVATACGMGPFNQPEGPLQSYLLLLGYLSVILVIALYLSASAANARRAMSGLQHEIQEQRRIRARLIAINELSGDAIITLNRNCQITSFNRAAVALFGYSLPDVIGQPLEDLIPPSDLAAHRAEMEAFFDVEDASSPDAPLKMEAFRQITYRRKDGSIFVALAAMARIRTDQTVSCIIAIRDMTEFEGKETALRDALREARLAIRAKDEFLANMSHELRTPLNAVIGFAETLKLRLFGDLNDRQLDYIGDIEASGRHLLSLINGILNYARLEKGNWVPAFEAVDVGIAIAASCRMLTDKARDRGITLKHRSDAQLPYLHCDPVALRQIVINLVDNAIKFSNAGGIIAVSASLAAGGDSLTLTVSDDGIGIHSADQLRILEPFTQAAHATTRHHEGLGLGLSIVKRLVEAHDASLQVASAPGQGTSIMITWPASRLLPPL